MRSVYAFLIVSVDGFHATPDGGTDWFATDDEFERYSAGQGEHIDTIVMGRRTFELMASYWPTPAAQQDDPRVAAKMNGLPKLVVSRTLREADWANTRIIDDDVAGELTKLKQQPGKDIAVFGSSDLTVSLLGLGLVDELRIMVAPVVLGAGRSLFRTAPERIHLQLLSTRAFRSGNVLHTYRPAAR